MDKPFVLYSSGLMYDYKKTQLLNLYLSSLISSRRVLPCLDVLSGGFGAGQEQDFVVILLCLLR